MNLSVRSLGRRRLAFAMAGAVAAPLLLRRDGVAAEPLNAPLLDRQTAIRLAAAQRGMCSSATQSGVGLRGEYIASPRLTDPPFLVRIDKSVDFERPDLAAIAAAAGRQPRAARWTGWLRPVMAGEYGFAVTGARARVTVANQVLFGAKAPPDARIALTPQRFYPVSVEIEGLSERTSSIRLEWLLPHGVHLVVPQANLFPPTDAHGR